ncbi:MAG: SpoIIE family protein phosphatase [Desulfobacterales bacterium]|nr:MAG: SpoIIE family protein phosphatase [Desulfobacterales bacterium]
MTKTKLFHLKNEMLAANFLANFFGVFFVNTLIFMAEAPAADIHPISGWIDALFNIFAFLFVGVVTLRYERPIRQYLNATFRQGPVSRNLEIQVRRRVINEPFFLIVLDLSMWLSAAVLYPTMYWALEAGSNVIQRALFIPLSSGLTIVTIAFFLLEHVLQKRLTPYIFPNGGLSGIPNTLRIRIRTRLAALFFGCNLIPLLAILHIFHRLTSVSDDPTTALEQLRSAIITNSLIFIGVGFCLTMLVSRNFTLPLEEIVRVLKSIRNGFFHEKVQVTSNDEIGYTGDVINEMTEGLQERDRMRRALDLAMEVQQNLLPNADPTVAGLDIAGTSIYCEETGGDYFDYLSIGEVRDDKIGIIVGDVSDHGVPSALLMTTVRAFLRQRSSRSGDLDEIIADVNQQLCRDVEDSGRFVTLFLAAIDRRKESIRWVNAGHDPALLYDPETAKFEPFVGHGLPLGVAEDTVYRQYQRPIASGQIIVIGTDGIWESQNSHGQMFGKDRFRQLIQKHAHEPARRILKAVIETLDEFCASLERTDDVTLVVIKIEKIG